MTGKMTLRHRIMAIRFAIWDLHLYLDTHCGDEKAQELLEKYLEKYRELLPEYECKYGPVTFTEGTTAAWLKNPFPWENEWSEC